jgi:hypothetical protein
MRRHGLFLNDVEYFPDLHGGTLRWHGRPATSRARRCGGTWPTSSGRAGSTLAATTRTSPAGGAPARRPAGAARGKRAEGATIAAYGAAAKGSTMLNYVGIGTDLVDFVVDRNTHKQGRFMPGVHLPIRDPASCSRTSPTTCCCWRGTSPTRSWPSRPSTAAGAAGSSCPCRPRRCSSEPRRISMPTDVGFLPGLRARRPSRPSTGRRDPGQQLPAAATQEEATAYPRPDIDARRSAPGAASSPTPAFDPP